MSERGRLLQGVKALITGAARGIGASVAARYLAEGASIYVVDQDADALSAMAQALSADSHRIHFRECDVTNPRAVEEVVAEGSSLMRGLNTVVANAGRLVVLPIEQLDPAQFASILDVNVVGVFNSFRAAVPHLRAAGGGTLLATSSIAGIRGSRGLSAYSASKFAVRGLVECLAAELGPDNIRVCAVAPGSIRTDMIVDFFANRARSLNVTPGDYKSAREQAIPLRRLGEPLDVAQAFVYLASPLASFVSGATLTVDGGELYA